MIHDEFNNVVISNEKDGFTSFEYGSTQKHEFTSYKDNKSDVRDELNPTTNRNNENVEIGKNQTNNNDLIDKIAQATEAEAAATTTASSAASGGAVAATSAASASSSVVASVSVVAVVGVSTLVGISVVSNNNASVKFKCLDIYPESINYVLNLYDTDDDHFSIYLENDNYLSYNALEEGENEGNFSGLVLGDTYRIYVKEESQSGKIIYDEKITTTDNGTHSLMNGLVWDKTANFKDLSFTVKIDYYDSEERYSDFKLTLENTRGIRTVLSLEATDQEQTLYVKQTADYEVVDIRKDSLKYAFSYMEKDEEVIFEEGDVTFTDNSNGQVVFTDVNINPNANLLLNKFEVTLSYIDDFDYLDNFYLVVTPLDGSLSSERIELSKQLEPQEVSLPEEKLWPTKLFGLSLSYYVEYENDGVTFASDSKEVTFIDNQGRSQVVFNDVSIDSSVDLLSDEFEVTLSYIDDFGLLDSFILHYRPANTDGSFIEYPLATKTTSQSVHLSGNDGSSTSGDGGKILYDLSLEYYVSYTNDGSLLNSEHHIVEFIDNQGRTSSVFNQVTIDESANLLGDTFEVTLDYSDDFGFLDNFVLYYKELYSDYAYTTYTLTKQTTPQTVPLSLPVSSDEGGGTTGSVTAGTLYDKSLSYYVTYTNHGVSETSATKAVTFVDSQGRVKSSFNDAAIDSSANLLGNTFQITLDYTDDFGLIGGDDIYLYYKPTGEDYSFYSTQLAKQTTAQQVTYTPNFGEDLFDVSLDYYVTYSLDGITNQTTQKSVTFVDSFNRRESQLIDVSINPEVDVMTNDIEVTLDYIDDYEFLDSFVLYYEDTSAAVSDGYIEQEISKQTDPQIISVFVNMERLMGVSFNYYVECVNTRTDETLSTEVNTVTFVDADGRNPTVFNSATINPSVDAASNVFQITLDYTDDFGLLDDLYLYYKLIDSPAEYNEPLLKQTTAQSITLTSDIADNLYNLSLSYYVSYTIDGEQLQTSRSEVMFSDSQSRQGPTFNDVTINSSVDVLGDEFEVTLDYIDYFNKLDNFTLFYTVQGSQIPEEEEQLTKTTSAQIVTISSMFDVSKLYGLTLEYYVTYTNDGVSRTSTTKTVTFVDSLNRRETVFNDVTINPSADILSNQVSVTLSYIDDYGFLEEFTLCYQNASGGQLYSETISKQLTAQTVTLSYLNNLEDLTLEYYVVFYNNGDQEVSTTKTVTFTDSQNRQSIFNDATIDYSANFINKTFSVTLDYEDGLDHFSDFEITLEQIDENSGETAGTATLPLLKTTQTQTVDVSNEEDINIWNGTFNITIDYTDNRTGQTVQGFIANSVSFSNSLSSSFDGLDSDWIPLVDNSDGSYYLPIRLDFVNDAEQYTEFRMVIDYYDDWPIALDITTDWQYADMTSFITENGSVYGNNADIQIFADVYDYATEDISEELVYDTNIDFGTTATSKMYGAHIIRNTLYSSNETVSFKLIMSDDSGNFSNFKLVFNAGNDTYSFPFTINGSIYTTAISVDISSKTDLITYLGSNACDVYIEYFDSNENNTLLMNIASNYWFEIVA